jgi:hypothetical protein
MRPQNLGRDAGWYPVGGPEAHPSPQPRRLGAQNPAFTGFSGADEG